MARKTSFYYSFLVLPADQRRAIIAVWDFCRAVDDAVDERRAAADGVPAGRTGGAGGAVLARRAGALLRRGAAAHAAGPAAAAIHRARSTCRGRRSRTSSTAWRWISTPPATRRSTTARVLPPRGLGGRHDLHPDLRLPEHRRARLRAEPGRRAAADEHPARRQGRPRPRPRLPAARGSRGPGARSRIWRPAACPSRCGVCSRSSAAARSEFYRRAVEARPAEDRRGWSRPRSCAPCTSRRCGASSAAATTCSPARARVPRPQAGADRAEAVAVASHDSITTRS